MIILAFFLSFAGWTALALAMNRHRRDMGWAPATASVRGALRLMGAALLAGSYGVSALHWGWSEGAVAWFGVLTVAAFGLVLALAFKPKSSVRS
ncbi:MAG: DUF3325 domain-containing protein [Rhodospirillales bacterium]